MASFKIRGADGNEYGPVPADVVVQWIGANRVARHSLAQAEGSTEWKPLSAFPEFQSALFAQSVSPPPAGGAHAPPGGQQQGLAIASLILGICGITCLSVFGGIPAIILGHLAHNRSRRQPAIYGGSGMAIAGLVMGYLSLIWLPVMAGLFLPALAKAKDRAQTISCANQMKIVNRALRQYASEHNDGYPTNLLVLSNRVVSPNLLVCPSDPVRRKPRSWNDVAAAGTSYECIIPSAESLQQPSATVVLRCPIHGNVGHADGSVSQGTRKQRSGAAGNNSGF